MSRSTHFSQWLLAGGFALSVSLCTAMLMYGLSNTSPVPLYAMTVGNGIAAGVAFFYLFRLPE